MRKKLSEFGKLNNSCKIKVIGDNLLIPINSAVYLGEAVQEGEFEVRGPRYRCYKDAVKGVPEDLMDQLPTSFDTIGDIATVKIPKDLRPYGKEIAKALLLVTPALRLVAADIGVSGERRIRDLQVLAGEGGLETTHREHGIDIMVDLSKSYFSPRLATERYRVASLVKEGERVLDMFAGVGPFSLLIAKRVRVEKIWALDINPDAIDTLKRNMEVNGVSCIEAICGDAKAEITRLPPLDRIIMNLPQSGHEYLGGAIAACANDATIHYYEISNTSEGAAQRIKAMGSRIGRCVDVMAQKVVRSFSPSENHYVYDLKVHVGAVCSDPSKRKYH